MSSCSPLSDFGVYNASSTHKALSILNVSSMSNRPLQKSGLGVGSQAYPTAPIRGEGKNLACCLHYVRGAYLGVLFVCDLFHSLKSELRAVAAASTERHKSSGIVLKGDQHASDAQLKMYPKQPARLPPNNGMLSTSVQIVQEPAFSCFILLLLLRSLWSAASFPSSVCTGLGASVLMLLCILSWPQRHLNRMMPQKQRAHREQASPSTCPGTDPVISQPMGSSWVYSPRYMDILNSGGSNRRRSYTWPCLSLDERVGESIPDLQ